MDHEPHVAPRGQKPPSPGVVVASLQLPRLGQGDDAIDAKTLSFLVSRSLAELEEERRVAKVVEDEVAKEMVEVKEEKKEDKPVPESVEWVRLFDPTGKSYFWNRRTGSTVWDRPVGVKVVWVGTRDKDGDLFFWHDVSQASQRSLPPLPPE